MSEVLGCGVCVVFDQMARRVASELLVVLNDLNGKVGNNSSVYGGEGDRTIRHGWIFLQAVPYVTRTDFNIGQSLVFYLEEIDVY